MRSLQKLTPVACAVAAGLVGLATNLVRPTFFTNIELVLGGIAPLLVAAALGRWAGLVAGVICFCLTPLYWFHYVGWLAYGVEAFVVGHLMHHRRLSLLGASLRYWLCFGMPVAAVYFAGFSYAAFPANIIALVKYPLNGLLVALVAQEISNHRRFQRLARNVGGHVHLPQLQDLLITRFTSLTALPILIISLVAYGALDRQLSQTAEYNLQREAMELRDTLETHFERTAAAWSSLLEERNRERNPAARGHLGVQRWLAQHPAWLDLHFIDSRGEQSAVPAPNESAGPSASLSAPTRVTLALQDANGTSLGLGVGTLDVIQLEAALLRPMLSDSRELLLLQKDRAVLLMPPGGTSDLRERVMTQTFLDGLLLPRRNFTHDRWHPSEARMERFRATVVEVPRPDWILVLEEPLWRSQSIAAKFFLTTLGLVAAAIVLVNLLSRATAAEITAPLKQLALEASALSRDATTRSGAPAPPRVSTELEQIHESISTAAAKLSETNRELAIAVKQRDRSHDELQKVLNRLEQSVLARTADLQQALLAAEAANRTKGEFIGMMSHELRTPLNVMLGSVELLLRGQRGDITSDQSQALRTVEENGLHLLSLIDDVLDFSRDESGKLTLHRKAIDPGEVCALACRLIAPHAQRKQQTLSASYEHTVANLSADPKRMRQMVINLLANAIKFTPVGGEIRLKVWEPPASQTLRISISDTGIGIPAHQLEEIFVPFHQLDRSLSRQFEGSGLGLTLVRRLINLHGGAVTVESTVAQGSTFHLDFPLPAEIQPRLPIEALLSTSPLPALAPIPSAEHAPDQVDGFLAGRSPSPDDSDTRPPTPPRVLIVEDNATIADLLRSYLSVMGCDSWVAANGEIGVRRAAEIDPHLILMDVQMPVMDGIEATRRIRANTRSDHPGPPIVMVTALASADDRRRAFAAGASDYLTKPISMSAFSEAVARHLSTRPSSPP